MPSSCSIELDHPNDVYYSGQNLNGFIKLTITSNKTVRGVHITINGYAKAKFNVRKTRVGITRYQSHSVPHSALDQYLNSRTYVAGTEGGSSFELAAGTYNHTFYCPLPFTLPTSVSGKYGEIKYEVIVTIDRPFRFDNVFKRGFTVIQELDLNLDPIYRAPKSAVDEKEFRCTCCCFGGAGTVSTKFMIPFGGYAPGQKIKFSLLVANESANDLVECKVKLQKRITFEARSPSRKEKHTTSKLDAKQFPKIRRNSTKHFEDELLIPAGPPSSTFTTSCVRIDYLVYAKIVTGCCRSNIDLTIPIVIGTVPLFESATNPENVITVQPTAPTTINIDDGRPNAPPPGHKIVAPLSYEDAIIAEEKFVDDEKDDKHQEEPFAPKYPVYYNFAQPPSAPSFANGHSCRNVPENQSVRTYVLSPNN